MVKKSIGSILSLIAAILSILGIVLYTLVLFKTSIVYVFLAAGVVTGIITVLGMKKEIKITWGLPILSAVFMASSVVWAINPMVNTIGYVIAGLNEMNTVTGLIYFLIAAVISMILHIVASFTA